MTPGYDVERLRVVLEQARAAVAAVQMHKLAGQYTWRIDRLRREIEEFSAVMWPPKALKGVNK